MIIVEDTRQQTTKHKNIEKHFQSINQPSVRSKLIVGDYARLDNQTVSIDTKKDIVEISGNICGGQHERFRAECELARKCGIQLIVLIEEVPPKGDLDNWQSPRLPTITLSRRLPRLSIRHRKHSRMATGRITENIWTNWKNIWMNLQVKPDCATLLF